MAIILTFYSELEIQIKVGNIKILHTLIVDERKNGDTRIPTKHVGGDAKFLEEI